MAHPLSLAFLTLFDAGPVEVVRIAAAAGYQMVGLRLLPAAPGEGDYPLMTDDGLLAEVAAALKETGLAVADVEIARLKPETDVAAFEPFFDRAALLGAGHVLVAGDDPDEGRLAANFARLCVIAASRGLTADLEFMPWTSVPDLAAARRIVEIAGAENGGVLVDALHVDRSGTTLEEVRALPPERINYVQLCDAPAVYDKSVEALVHVARAARLNPGEGGIDLVGLAGAVPDGTTVSVEVPNRGLARSLTPRDRAELAFDATRRVLEKAGRAVQTGAA